MKKIGFLGCGKIGKALLNHMLTLPGIEITFIQDPSFVNDMGLTCPILAEASIEMYQYTDLVIECATAEVLKRNIEQILPFSDLMVFSVTAFCDPSFEQITTSLSSYYHHKIFIPHGAILGIDGIFDGNKVWQEIDIITTKSPASLGRSDAVKTVVYQGPTREVCKLYPRNVNVHACIALAGIGFDKTKSFIISDPGVTTNAHAIRLKGDGIEINMHISSYANGSITGAYTPHSACGSLDRILEQSKHFIFV